MIDRPVKRSLFFGIDAAFAQRDGSGTVPNAVETRPEDNCRVGPSLA
jgi:hypothetical protein